jgi:hypothetical protein
MPDLANRQDHEEELAAAVLALFDDWRDRAPQFSAMEGEFAGSQDVATALAETFAEAAGTFVAKRAADKAPEAESRLAQQAAEWAARRTRELAAEVVRTTRDRIAVLPADDAEAEAALDSIFGADRAASIAITETTRAISAGEKAAAEWATAAILLLFDATWYTRADERVCDICGPLHGKPEAAWQAQFPGGPPAHPRCRCWVEWG